VGENEIDTGERIRRVYRYVDKETERVEKSLSGQMASGFKRVERALEQVTSDVTKTREAVVVVSTKVESLEDASSLERQQEPLKEILIALKKEKKSVAPAVLDTKKAILLTGGGAIGGGGLIAGLLKFLEWVTTF
jgi:hypothetical protein